MGLEKGRFVAPPKGPAARPTWKKVALYAGSLALFPFTFLGIAGMISTLWKEWQAGTAFHRYKTWKGIWVSHADVLILGVVMVVAIIAGVVWTRWDRWRERRDDEEILDQARRRGRWAGWRRRR